MVQLHALTGSRESAIISLFEIISGFSFTVGCLPSIASQWAEGNNFLIFSGLKKNILLRIETSNGNFGTDALIIWSSCTSWSSIHWTSRWFEPVVVVVLNGKLPFVKWDPTIGYEKKNNFVSFFF
jgi:hypothetical protein